MKAFCPSDIEVTYHNSSESCTISGPEESMKIFLPQLHGSGVSTKDVPFSNIAYHQKYKSEAGELWFFFKYYQRKNANLRVLKNL